MTIPRLIVVLGLSLAAMLGVVVLRADNTRLHYEMSKLDRRAELLQREMYERQLELARLKSPSLIWTRATEMETGNVTVPGPANDKSGAAHAAGAGSAKKTSSHAGESVKGAAKPEGKKPKPPARKP